MKVYDLTVNGAAGCNVLPASDWRISWKISSELGNVMQKSYRITVSCEGNTVYDSGETESEDSIDVTCGGFVPENEKNYTITVSVKDTKGEEASVSSEVGTELAENGWGGAKWIRPKKFISGWAPYLRTKFKADGGEIKSAELWCCGLGIGEFYVNGQRTDDSYIDVPATNYERTVLYRKYDVTGLVKEGGNALAVTLGEGFYSQSRVWGRDGFVYGKVCAIAKLKITYKTGAVQTVVTDTNTWKYKYSPYITNNLYAGETYDCRLETPDFALYDGDEDGWGECVEDTTPKGKLTGCLMPPVKIIRELPCIGVECSSGKDDGCWIFDLGENFAGIYEVTIPPSPVGAVYTFRTSEVVNPQGDLDHRSTGAMATQCIQQDIYISRGDPAGEVYRPHLTYHGFRYVEITGIHDFSEGYGTIPKKTMIKGLQLSTAMEDLSEFKTDCKDLDKFFGIMKNTYRSNYHGYPEDCPAREKCGWLGDAEVVCNFGLLTYNGKASYEKYLDDIRTSNDVYGVWQMIAPGKRGCGEASPLWGCAQIIIPYYMWKYYGDSHAITSNIDLMRLWVKHEENRAKDFIITEGLGDWDPVGGNENPRRMPVPHSSTFMFYEIAVKMAEISRVFGYGDEEKYDTLAANIRAAINKNFYSAEDHSYGYWGSNGVALSLGFYPDGEHDALLNATLGMIKGDRYAMPTGIYANKSLVPALFNEGYGEEALKYLFNRGAASFGTMMDDSATTVWECPDMQHVTANKKKGLASFNHPMHGGFVYAYYTTIAGIEPLEPGFKKFRIMPRSAASINELSCSIESPYGKIAVSYKKAADGCSYTVTVPANTTAVFVGFDGKETELGSGTYTL